MPDFLGETSKGNIGLFNPAYLVKSRCGVFYLRWPLPKQLHPEKRASTLKLSLQTREPRKALRLSRSLSQIGERLNEYGIAYGMRHEELGSVLTEHFRQLLDEAKVEMNDTGPLSELDRQSYETSKLVAKQAGNCWRCSATNAYLTLHPWRNTRWLFFRMSRSSVTRASSFFRRRISAA